MLFERVFQGVKGGDDIRISVKRTVFLFYCLISFYYPDNFSFEAKRSFPSNDSIWIVGVVLFSPFSFRFCRVSLDESSRFSFTWSHFTSHYVTLEDLVRDDTHEIDTPYGYVVYYCFLFGLLIYERRWGIYALARWTVNETFKHAFQVLDLFWCKAGYPWSMCCDGDGNLVWLIELEFISC